MKVLLAPGGLWPEPAGVPLAGSGPGLAPGRVASCLARGWRAVRPHDALTLLPMADGGPGSAQVIAPDQVVSREVIQGRGPLGQVREVDLVRLVPRRHDPGTAIEARRAPGSWMPLGCWHCRLIPMRRLRRCWRGAPPAWEESSEPP